MTSLVTGAAGFVGSHLCELLLERGERVRGVDCFTDYYQRSLKDWNLSHPTGEPGFSFVRGDLTLMDLEPLLEDVDVIYHLAGQPGVRPSWGAEFSGYLRNNIEATQRLLEACRSMPVRKIVYASSSSVYGDAEAYPTAETLRPQPVSPYGVTKLAAEHLCELYRSNFGTPTVSLRLFTVYGPRQRPDMAFSRLVSASLRDTSFRLFGDGEQTRDFTFVGDVVRAFRDAADSEWTGVANIGGGSRTSMKEVLRIASDLCGPLNVVRMPEQEGDVRHTAADIGVARAAFGYEPRTSLAQGLAEMVSAERHRAEVFTS